MHKDNNLLLIFQEEQVVLLQYLSMYSARNLEMSIHFSLKSRPSERFHRPEMSQIKAEVIV